MIRRLMLFSLVSVFLFGGCDLISGSSDDGFPGTAKQASEAYNLAPDFMSTEIINPDLVVTTNGYYIQVKYQGEIIVEGTFEWGSSVYDGFTARGLYVFSVNTAESGDYWHDSLLYMDGSLVTLPASNPINGVREYLSGNEEWLIIKLNSGHIRSADRKWYWVMYNTGTGNFIDFGEYGDID